MSTIRFSTVIGPDQLIRPPEGVQLPPGQVEIIVVVDVGSWTETKNERRCALIRKKFSQGISAAETRELAELQEEVSAYRKQSVPLPYDVIAESGVR